MLCTRSLLPSTHNSQCTPLDHVCWVPIASIIAAIDFACRSHAEIACRAITIATSHICDSSQHVRAAHHPNGSVRFFSSQRHSNCFTGSIGSVCARQHTRWSRFPLCIAPNLTASTTKPVTTLPSTILLQRQPCSSSPLSNAWTAPSGCSSLPSFPR